LSRAEVGLVQTAIYFSATLVAMVGGRLADRIGERHVLIASGLITGGSGALGRPRQLLLGLPVHAGGIVLVAVSYFDPPREGDSAIATVRPLRDLMADRRLWLLALTYNGQIVAQYASTVYLVLFLHEALGFPLVLASGLFALVNVVAIGARIAWGLTSDAVFEGARRPVLLIITALTLLTMLAAAALPRAAPMALAVGLAILLGLTAFSWTGIYGTLTIELAGRASAASAVAWVHVLGGVGSLGGAPLFGYLVDRTGSYRVAWVAAAVAVLIGLVATLRAHEGRRGG
jgi:ACS family hexuronate transporter-like MFS transporter